ncbi:hypothetical protein [Klebsiella michiganensis]|uniref:hypothetical protein n=1 Tax=Klebsiella michiganensis TaxID=1134687 RepID=UPI002550DE7A|nr:hypothetical protein [Klebsiella michiganensis]ELQ7900204.1 hypothetical protein [Klebsiella oxytoca]MDK9837860.1 hypothetical protein [Klebsiella michiganensis]
MTSKLTREWLKHQISAIEAVGITDSNTLAAFKLALAAMGSEPVAWTDEEELNFVNDMACMWTKGMGINEVPLYRHAQQPVVPYAYVRDERGRMMLNGVCEPKIGFGAGWNACRAAMLQAGNSPVIPDGYVMVPMRLTAENGAKGVLSGEFSETQFVNCPECFGDDECETCDGSGRIEIKVPVSWTTIKEIWIKGVEYFAAAPQENN